MIRPLETKTLTRKITLKKINEVYNYEKKTYNC